MKENKIQAEIYQWFNNNYCLKNNDPQCCIFAVPNGGTRNLKEAMTLKATGTLSGVSDLIVLLPNKILFIEVKTDIGTQSKEQKNFQERVEKLGFEYHLVRSLEDFKCVI